LKLFSGFAMCITSVYIIFLSHKGFHANESLMD
jgi:hypothetical protein